MGQACAIVGVGRRFQSDSLPRMCAWPTGPHGEGSPRCDNPVFGRLPIISRCAWPSSCAGRFIGHFVFRILAPPLFVTAGFELHLLASPGPFWHKRAEHSLWSATWLERRLREAVLAMTAPITRQIYPGVQVLDLPAHPPAIYTVITAVAHPRTRHYPLSRM